MKSRILHALLGIFLFAACSNHYQKNRQDFAHYSLRQSPENALAMVVVAEYKTKVDAETERVIARSAAVMDRSGDQSALGNFVCDALLHAGDSIFKTTPPDMVIVNRGGLRINLPKGDIKVSTIFELMPFENELVLVTVSGEKLKEFIPLFEQKKHSFAGAQIRLKNNKVSRFLVNGQEIDPAKNYRILTSDYLANGGDGFTFLQSPVALQPGNFKVRDAIIYYCTYLTQQGKQLTPYTDERLYPSN